MMQYLGWAGDLFLVAGLWLVGNRWRPAFLQFGGGAVELSWKR